MKKFFRKEGNIAATVVMIIVIIALFVAEYAQISSILRKRSLGRMEEGVKTVMNEVKAKFERDSRILNSAAEIIAAIDINDSQTVIEALQGVSPLLDTMEICVLTEDEKILITGGVADATKFSDISFEDEAPRGEHVSGRVPSVSDGSPILRHFVPIVQEGRTVALLYGVTELENLPYSMNVGNIYNSAADVYIIDAKTGDFIMDTMHDELKNVRDYSLSDSPENVKGEKSWDDFISDFKNLGSGYVIFRTPEADDWEYMYYAPAGLNDWAIAVSVPEHEAFESMFAARQVCAIIGALMAVAIAVYYIIIHRQAQRATQNAVERAVLEEKLVKAEAAERAKTTFLSNMSHDIRTPMNAIISFTTLAETNLDNRSKVQEYLAKIMSSSNHLLSLINDVLDMSRIESGKLYIEEKPCTISDIFRDMRNIIQSQMQSKQLNFFMDTMDVVDEDIYCDKLHVNQVLLNLLSNAIKFTPAGGSVSMLIRQKPGAPTGYGAYEIRVKDTGIGMSPEFAEHIFEPFERERNSTVSGIQGTGLGMAISKNIIDTMGGTIEVKTERNKGTEFVINFQFRLQSEKKQVDVVKELVGIRGLVVDDSFNTCDSVTKMLVQIGVRAEWSMHGREAVLRARQASEMGDEFMVYIIDWALPDLSGIEVARQVRAIAGENVPIIVLTAYDWTAFEDEAKAAGVTAFCNKPIFLSELRDTLISALGKSEAEDYAEPKHNPVEDLKGSRLLLVEDNELNREIAEEFLSEYGFVVESATDGTEAVEMVSGSKPGYYDLILMDVQMPIMNGYDATRAIRALQNPDLANIPIVAMTANAFDEDRRQAIESGMNDHVAKPIDIDNLLEVVAAQIGEK